MANLSFRMRMVWLFAALFFAVQAVTLGSVYWFLRDNLIGHLTQNLGYAEQLFRQMLAERGERVAGETRILVADFGFRSAASQADPETLTSALENLTYRIRGQRGLFIDLKGKVVADTAGKQQGQRFLFADALDEADARGRSVALALLDDQLAELAVVPVLAPIPIGWVCIILSVDPRLTEQFKRLSPSGLDLSLVDASVGKTRLLVSSLPPPQWPELAATLEHEPLRLNGPPEPFRLGDEATLAILRKLPAADAEQSLFAVLQIDLTTALAPYRTWMYTAFAGSVLGFLAMLAGSIVVAERLIRPVRALADASEKLLNDGLGESVPRVGHDELGRLAETFNRAARLAAEMSELQQRDRMRRELVADVSHDFRTPLSALHGYLETLRIKADSLGVEERRRFLDVAVRQSEKLGRLAQELFELARLECEDIRPDCEPFCIVELVQDVVQKFLPAARASGVVLEADWTGDLPPVLADIAMIERVLTNLIDNAIRHTPAGGSVSIRFSAAAARVGVSVADSGPGIAPEFLPTLFDRSSPLSRSSSSSGGLGLILVGKMLSLQGGSIHAESRQGEGAVFRFELPAAAAVQHDST